MKYWFYIIFIGILFFTVSAHNNNNTGIIPIIETSIDVDEKKTGDNIKYLEINLKNRLVVCQILIALMMVVTFIQSGLDKLIDRKGNTEFFESHFNNTPLKSMTSISLTILTILEIVGGIICGFGIYFTIFEKNPIWIYYGLLLVSITIIFLFFGQRMAKDYEGAANLIPYFILSIIGIMITY